MNKMKTVELNVRGQIVIPQEFRHDLNLNARQTLVVIERDNELVIKKQESVLKNILEKEDFSALSEKSLKKVWDNKKDDVWAKYLK